MVKYASIALLLSMVFSMSFAHMAHATDWPNKTRSDLNWIFNTLRSNHPAFVLDDLSFIRKASAVEKDVLALAANAKDFNSYYLLIRQATNALGDAHLRITPASIGSLAYLKLRWPNFWVSFPEGIIVNGEYNGEKIQSCDGIEVTRLLNERVYPYFGNKKIQASAIQWGPRLMLDYQVPWLLPLSNCVLNTKAGKKEVPLRWTEVDIASWLSKQPELQFGLRPKVEGLRKSEKVYWVRLPTFLPSNAETDVYRKILGSSDFKDAPNIVFDLRGNTGGDSRWIQPFIEAALAPDEIKRFRIESDKLDQMTIKYRVSNDNLKRIKEIAIDPTNGSSDPEFEKLANLMDEAIKYDRKIVTSSEVSVPIEKIRAKVKTQKRIFVVTDGWCLSSCLVMLDKLKLLIGLKHLGWPTDADTRYLQVNQVTVPGIPEMEDVHLMMTYPMAWFDRRYRKDNIAYNPELRYPGRPSDQIGMEEWVMAKIER